MTKEKLLHITIILLCSQSIVQSISYVVFNNAAAFILRTLSILFSLVAFATLYASTKN